ncbi:amidohydrolase [Chryseobacterium formosense]|uniref:Amidohydrolase n=1 Tax=Chryseobacterium formosense TaxID=236814 RepID=A0A085Z5Q0_9FLAO|nr:amidohydrolase family protein [Chryseobacterium formosense]KFE99763.1 amidohydrolase [Chryseobacterium formosense]SFT70233.1 L-fuconolactonase [Chryseobacterium formosense]
MIIDSHVHFWEFDPVRDAWITEEMSAIRRDFSPDDFSLFLNENQIKGCIAVQADQSDEETKFLVSLAKENSFIKGVVGWIDLTSEKLEESLQNYQSEKLIKGFRHIAEGEETCFLLQENVLEGISKLHQFDYTFDILLRQDQLSDAVKLSEILPDQPFILDHCGKPDLKTNDLKDWKSNISELAQNPNIYCKVSGLLTQGNWNSIDEKSIFETLDFIFLQFGIKRLVFGSDWPVMLLGGNYALWLKIVSKYVSQFSKIEQELFYSGNAVKFYKL